MIAAAMDTYTLVNARGVEVRFIPFGGRIVSIRVPDRLGDFADIVPGYDDVASYASDTRYFGALIGRYANRIAGGRFSLDGVEYQLTRNEGANQLHGGEPGFHARTWRVAPFQRPGATGAVLCCKSPSGEDGYPGLLHTRVTYTLDDDNSLRVDYTAITDAPTVANFTQHSYFTLAGHDAGTILDHELMVNAAYFTPVDEQQIPTGVLRGVIGTPFDFTSFKRIGADIDAGDDQLRIGSGYDHNFALRQSAPGELTLAARLLDEGSGRVLEIHTTEPGVQVYTGNGLDRGAAGKGGYAYPRFAAVALETQHFPDSPNHPHFPSTVLRPGQELTSTSIYRFSTT